MLALCWSEAMLPTNGLRSLASQRKGGSTAPALQGAAPASRTAHQKKSRTVLSLPVRAYRCALADTAASGTHCQSAQF